MIIRSYAGLSAGCDQRKPPGQRSNMNGSPRMRKAAVANSTTRRSVRCVSRVIRAPPFGIEYVDDSATARRLSKNVLRVFRDHPLPEADRRRISRENGDLPPTAKLIEEPCRRAPPDSTTPILLHHAEITKTEAYNHH